jgi:hypothetical protein
MRMIEKNDWRLTNQMNYLNKKQLLHIPYQIYREGWDHDHCDFCHETIDLNTKMAYCTTDQYHWICESCFEDFKTMFQWEVKENGDTFALQSD